MLREQSVRLWLLLLWHQTRQDTTSKQASVPLMHSGGRQIVGCCSSWFLGSLMKPSTWAYWLSTGGFQTIRHASHRGGGGWHLFHFMPKIQHEMKETCTCQENNNRKVVTVLIFFLLAYFSVSSSNVHQKTSCQSHNSVCTHRRGTVFHTLSLTHPKLTSSILEENQSWSDRWSF